jgi:hypothetical protein
VRILEKTKSKYLSSEFSHLLSTLLREEKPVKFPPLNQKMDTPLDRTFGIFLKKKQKIVT